MRNIDQQQEAAKNGATTVTTKTKYRDFSDFLGRKQEESESKKNGDEADRKPKVPYSSYKEFLENYNTKKFSSVRPAVPVQEKKTMKSEIFIQVNGDAKKPAIERSVTDAPLPPPPPPEFFTNNGVQRNNTPPPPPPPFFDHNHKKTVVNSNGTVPPPEFESKRSISNDPIPPVPEFLETLLKKRAAALQKTNNDGEINTTTYVPVVDETDRIDKNDPNVKKLVYNTYRGLLGAYNHKANDIVSTLPRHCVREDRGITKQLESIA